MMRLFGLLLIATLLPAFEVNAQSLRIQTEAPKFLAEVSPWSGYLRYSVLTDYAEAEQPRLYTQSVRTGGAYKFDEHWSLSADFSLRAETLNGQIDKSRENTYAETLSPSTAFELDYDHAVFAHDAVTLFLHGEPLWDQPSQREGYRGVVGGGASLSLFFFGKWLVQEHVFDASELINTFKYATDTTANPDTFFTYKIVHSVRLYEKLRLAYTFGIKMTQYTDYFVGYSYSNTVSLSTSWHRWSGAIAYDNGGFTDNGQVSLWYLDQYRRVAIASLGYSF